VQIDTSTLTPTPTPLPDSIPTPTTAAAEPSPCLPAHAITIAETKDEIEIPKDFLSAFKPLSEFQVNIPRGPASSDRGKTLGHTSDEWSPTPPSKPDLAPPFPNATRAVANPVATIEYDPNLRLDIWPQSLVTSKLQIPDSPYVCVVLGVPVEFYSLCQVDMHFTARLGFSGKSGPPLVFLTAKGTSLTSTFASQVLLDTMLQLYQNMISAVRRACFFFFFFLSDKTLIIFQFLPAPLFLLG